MQSIMNITSVFGLPPAGVNLEDDRSSKDNAVVASICVLAILTVILRYFVRLYIQGFRLEVDDCLVGASLVPLVVLLTLSLFGGHQGFGRHVWCATLENMVAMKKSLFAYCLIYLAELLLIKASILMFYRRIFGMNWMNWACLILSCCWCLGSMIAALCGPQPVSYFWNELTDPTSGRYRYDFYNYYIGNAASNMVTDLLILLVPMPTIWRLQLRPGQKIGVCCILLLGGFVCVASIIRIHYLTFLNGNIDITWVLSEVSVWSTIEPCVGIICACLPAIQPFVRSIAKKLPRSQRLRTGRVSAAIQRQSPLNRHASTRRTINHEIWHGQEQYCNMSMKTFCSRDDQMRLTTTMIRGEMDTDPRERNSVEESLDPMSIRVERVVHWSVD